MKKIVSLLIVVVGLFAFTTCKAVTPKKVDFCNNGQKYLFDNCSDVETQCTYKNIDDENKIMYVNVDKYQAIKTDYGSVNNWGSNIYITYDAKNWYDKHRGNCLDRLIDLNDGVVLVNSTNLQNTKDEINKKSKYNIEGTYSLVSVTYNDAAYNKKNNSNNTSSKSPDVDSCAGFTTEKTCKVGQTKNAGNFGCAWNEQYQFCSPTGLSYLSCGSKDSIAYDIPVMVPRLTSYAITALKTITPVILIIIGMFQLIKAISSQNEDEMKKARSALIKKLIAAAMIFFLVAIVQFIVKQVADKSEQSSTEACFDCFINNNCSNAMYYTDGYGKCYAVSSNSQIDCPVDKY